MNQEQHIVPDGINKGTYTRVSEPSARRHWLEGRSVWLVSSKYRFDFEGHWVKPYEMRQQTEIEVGAGTVRVGSDFNQQITNFKWYNCNSEAGIYVRYFIKEAE